jgi:hypothetical protein
MTRSTWVVVICLLALLATAGCSSGSSDGNAELREMEERAAQALRIMDVLLRELDPFAPPPAPATGVPPDPCTDIGAGYCNLGGEVLECTTAGTDVDIQFNECSGTLSGPSETADFSVDGLLTYAVDQEVPRGAVSFSIDTESEGEWEYEMVFDHTDQVRLTVRNVDAGVAADCVGSLSTQVADCELIDPMI